MVNALAFLYSHRRNVLDLLNKKGEQYEVFSLGLERRRLGRTELLSVARRSHALLNEHVRRFQPDVIHIISITSYLLLLPFVLTQRRPVVVSIAGMGFLKNVAGLRVFVSWLNAIVNQLNSNLYYIFQNSYDRAVLGRGLAGRQITIPGSGVDLDLFAHTRLPGNKTILMVSRLIKEKGVLTFIEIARLALSQGADYRFVLVGGEDLKNPNGLRLSQLRQAAPRNLEIYGERDDVNSILTQSEVFVYPSYYGEGVPKSVLEAMSVGRPVIALMNHGIEQCILNGINGYLLDFADPKAFLIKIDHLMSNPRLRDDMSKKGRALAERNFGEQGVAAQHLRFYREIVQHV